MIYDTAWFNYGTLQGLSYVWIPWCFFGGFLNLVNNFNILESDILNTKLSFKKFYYYYMQHVKMDHWLRMDIWLWYSCENVGFFFCDYYCPNLQNDCHLCHIVKYMIHIEQTKLNHTKILYYLTSFGELKEYIELLQARERERESPTRILYHYSTNIILSSWRFTISTPKNTKHYVFWEANVFMILVLDHGAFLL